MRQIRRNVFETNSSSTHSLVICTEEQYEKLGRDYFIDIDCDEVVTKEEAIARYRKYYDDDQQSDEEILDKIRNLDSWEFKSDIYEWAEYARLDCDITKFETPSGDHMVAMCVYGNDY